MSPMRQDGMDNYWHRVEPEIAWVHRQLRRLGVKDSDVDDVTQDVLFAVYKKWGEYDVQRPVRAWLYAFVLRFASDYRKRWIQRHPPVALGDGHADERTDGVAAVEAASQRRRLARALDALDLEKRAILTLVDLEELTMPEAVELLQIPLNTGYSRLRAARAQLASAVADLADGRRA